MMTQQVRFHDVLETIEALPLYQQEERRSDNVGHDNSR